MKKALRVFTRDIKKIATNSMAIILAAGVLILPSLYAWVNIYANWDPYGPSATGNMQIAVMIEDKGVSFRGIGINVGEQVRENLQNNNVIDWQFLTKEEGVEGVKAGRYYAAIEIPENFSEALTSIVTGSFEPPKITYYANEKKNAIATKITDKVVQTVQGEVNASFIETVADMVSKVIGAALPEDGGAPVTASAISTDIQLAKTGIDSVQQTLQSFQQILSLSHSAAAAVPGESVQDLIADLGATVSTAGEAIKVTRASVDTLTASVETTLSAAASELETTAKTLSGIDGLLSSAASAHLGDASAAIEKQTANLASMIEALKNLNGAFPGGVGGLNDLLTRLESVQNELTQAGGLIAGASEGGAGETAKTVGDALTAVSSSLTSVSADYNASVKPALGSSVDAMLSVLEDLSGILTALGGSEDLKNLALALDKTAVGGEDVLNSLSALLSGFSEKLDSLAQLTAGLSDSETVNVIYNLLVNNGDALGSFLASPVQVDTDTVYGIENYGSAMAPFYSALAIWVGGVILIAIFKTDIKNKKELGGVKPAEEYFGRAMTFALFALIQGLIICVGDLYFLKIQCYHPLLFLLAGVAAALIYSFFIYSLVAAFGDIGKAIVVILLVIQLGGSGGTFPIDVTPAFFRAVNPYLPFTFVINAMRECVCGTWGADYWTDLLKLSAYIPAALALGLPVRRLLLKPVRFFGKKLEETGLL